MKIVSYDRASGPDHGPPADLWIIVPASMPFWAASDRLGSVPASYTAPGGEYAWEDVLPLYRKLATWNGKVYGLPILGDATLCFYREDLFSDSQHQAAFKKRFGHQLGAPETWEQFAEIAEYFNQQKRADIDHPCASLPPLPENDTDLDQQFYQVAAPFARRAIKEEDRKPPPDEEIFSFHYDLKTAAVRIDSPGFVHALQLLQKLQPYRAPGTAREPALAFVKGEAVLCLAGPQWIKRFQDNPSSRGKWGLCQVPGTSRVFEYHSGTEQAVAGANRVPYLGSEGWIGVVPRTSAEAAAAFALAARLGDPVLSKDIVIEPAWGGGALRSSHLDDRLGWQAFGLDADKKQRLISVLRDTLLHLQVKDPVFCLRIPDERSHREALDAEIRAALIQGKDASAALHTAVERWHKLDANQDRSAWLTTYRLSLGLSR